MSHRMDASKFDTATMRVVGYVLGGAFLIAWLWLLWVGWGAVVRWVL